MYFRLRFSTFLIVFLWLNSLSDTSAQGFKIDLKISGISDTTVILGHYLNKSMYADDTIRLDKDGNGVFKGKKALPEGLYIIFVSSSKYFEIIMGKDQDFSIETDTADFINNLKVKGSADNQIFADFRKFMLSLRPEMDSLQKDFQKASSQKDKDKIREKIKNLDTQRKQKIKEIYTKNPDLFISVFLKATLEVDVPEPPKNADGKVDSTWQYWYYRNHFFDNFDPADVRLLYTPMYEDKIMEYLDKVIPQIPDTLNNAVDYLINKSKSDSVLFRYMVITLFNHYGKSNIMGMDAVQVHIAEKYYLTQSWWNDKKFLDDLRERVKILEPLLLGKTAPDVELRMVPTEHFIAAAADTGLKRYPHAGSFFHISDVKADYVVLVFWEATCSHCKKAVPELYRIYKQSLEPMGVKVIAVSTLFGIDGKEKWVDFVNEHKLYDWINAWNPYDADFKTIYDVRSTPQIYVLNQDKKIIGKHLGPEDVLGLIQAYQKQFPKTGGDQSDKSNNP